MRTGPSVLKTGGPWMVCGCFSLILKWPEGTDSIYSPTVWALVPRLPFCTEDCQPIAPLWLPWSPAPNPRLLQILFQKLYPGWGWTVSRRPPWACGEVGLPALEGSGPALMTQTLLVL